jgi:hypothetical protein
LRLVDLLQLLDGFQVQQNAGLDDRIGNGGSVELDTIVDQGQTDFAFDVKSGLSEFVAEAFGIDGFEQSGAKAAMNLDAEAADFLGQAWGAMRMAGDCLMAGLTKG